MWRAVCVGEDIPAYHVALSRAAVHVDNNGQLGKLHHAQLHQVPSEFRRGLLRQRGARDLQHGTSHPVSPVLQEQSPSQTVHSPQLPDHHSSTCPLRVELHRDAPTAQLN